MGTTLGNGIRNRVRNLISSRNIRTSFTLTPITRTKGADGGHEAVVETPGPSRTIYGVPYNLMSNLIDLLKMGDLNTGEIGLAIRDDETIDTDDKVTFNGSDYDIRAIEPITYNELVICQALILSQRLT